MQILHERKFARFKQAASAKKKLVFLRIIAILGDGKGKCGARLFWALLKGSGGA